MHSLPEESPPAPKYVFFGISAFSLCVLKVLCISYTPIAVVTTPKSLVETWCAENDIPYLYFDDTAVAKLTQKLSALHAEVFVVAGFLKIPNAIHTLPPGKTLNIHPSLLPKYRGSRPIQAQMMDGDSHFGFTVHVVDDIYDHGDIVLQKRYFSPYLYPYVNDIGLQLASLAGSSLAEILPDYIAGRIAPIPQNHADATYTKDFVTNSPILVNSFTPHATLDRYFRAVGYKPGLQFNTAFNASFFITQAYFNGTNFRIGTVRELGSDINISYKQWLESHHLESEASLTQYQ